MSCHPRIVTEGHDSPPEVSSDRNVDLASEVENAVHQRPLRRLHRLRLRVPQSNSHLPNLYLHLTIPSTLPDISHDIPLFPHDMQPLQSSDGKKVRSK